MAVPNRLKELQERLGDLNEIIPPLVNEHGQAEAARLLGTTQPTISKWLNDNGYVKRAKWERDEPQPVAEEMS